MSHIHTIRTETVWYPAVQYAPDAGCPVLVLLVADDGFSVGLAEISLTDGEWRCCHDDSRLDPDDIEMWAEVALPKFHN